MGINKKKKIKPPKKKEDLRERVQKKEDFSLKSPKKTKSSKTKNLKQRVQNKGFKKIKPLQKKKKSFKRNPLKREFHKKLSKRTRNSNTRYKVCGI